MKDTFTFLMTAKYPLQDSRLCNNNNRRSHIIIEEEEEDDEEEEEEENVSMIIEDSSEGNGGTQNHHHEEGEEAPPPLPPTNDKIPIIGEGRTGEGVNTTTTATTTTSVLNGRSTITQNKNNKKIGNSNNERRRRRPTNINNNNNNNKSAAAAAAATKKKRALLLTKHNKRKSLLKNVDPNQFYLPFWLASFVVCCQLFIYAMVNLSILNDELPPNADQLLRLAQVFAVLVTLYTQSDFIDGIFLLTERWKSFKDITTPGRFYISAMIRIITGNIGIFTTFVLVMYSEEVVDMLLNFTAMEFVAKLDDAAFELAAKGFLGGALESHTDIVRGFKYVPRHSRRRRRYRLLIYVFYFLLVFGGFFAIVALQESRSVGIDNEVYIQFDDTGFPELFGVSGVYKGCRGFRTHTTYDIAYIDISSDCPSLKVDGEETDLTFPAETFIYCRDPSMKSWVYITKATNKPCENFLIRSILDDDPLPTHAFDILTHSLATWIVVRKQFGSRSTLENVFLRSANQVPVFFNYCGSDGDGGLIRLDKDLRNQRPFERLPKDLYPIFEDDASDLNGQSYFDAFQLVYRPIYVRKLHDVWNEDHTYQALVFDGLRWNHVYINPVKYATFIGKQADCQKNADSDPDCWMVFIKHFKNAYSLRSRFDLAEDIWRSNPDILVFDGISDPMLFLTATDTGIPTENLRFYESRVVLAGVEFGGGYHITPGQPKPAYDGIPRFSDLATHQGSSSIIDANEDGTTKQGGRHFAFKCNVDIELNCDAAAKELYINFGTDIFPEESSVLVFYGEDEEDMKDLDTAKRIFAEDAKTKVMRFDIPDDGLVDFRFLDHSTDHVLGTCVPESRPCVQVIVLDQFGDGLTGFVDDETGAGYELLYGKGGVTVEGGDGLYRCRLYHFGDACKNSTNSTEPINCDYDNVMENFPQQVIGEETPYVPSVEDFLQGTFVVTYEAAEEDVPQSVSFELDCAENEIGLKVEITTDTTPEACAVSMFFGQNLDGDPQAKSEAYKLVPTSTTGQFELSEDALVALTFPFALTSYAVGTCVPVETPCIQIMVMDKDADGISGPGGYTITYGTEQPVSSSDSGNSSGWGCRHYQFGSGCINTLEKSPDECDAEALLSKILLENVIIINF